MWAIIWYKSFGRAWCCGITRLHIYIYRLLPAIELAAYAFRFASFWKKCVADWCNLQRRYTLCVLSVYFGFWHAEWFVFVKENFRHDGITTIAMPLWLSPYCVIVRLTALRACDWQMENRLSYFSILESLICHMGFNTNFDRKIASHLSCHSEVRFVQIDLIDGSSSNGAVFGVLGWSANYSCQTKISQLHFCNIKLHFNA